MNFIYLIIIQFVFFQSSLFGAASSNYHLDGSLLSFFWVLPFAGLLLSIAFMPLFCPRFWHHHYGKVAFFWVFILVFNLLLLTSFKVVAFEILHVLLLEYIPFINLLFISLWKLISLSKFVTWKSNFSPNYNYCCYFCNW